MSNNIDKSKTPVTPDNYGKECLFLRMFFENMELFYAFPIIAREFLKHEGAYLEEYNDVDYGADTPKEAPKTLYINMKILKLMYGAAKKGSEYSTNLLVYLYRMYYKQEYNELMHYQVLNSDDALDVTRVISEDGDYNDWRLSRILVMAPFVGVKLGDTADVDSIIEADWKTIYDNKCAALEKTIPEDLLDECAEQVFDWVEANDAPFTPWGMPYWWRARKLACESLRISGYTQNYITDGKGDDVDYIEEQNNMIRALALLRMKFPDKHFSFKDVQIYSVIYTLATKITRELGYANTALDDLLGISREFPVEKPKHFSFKAETVTGRAGIKSEEPEESEPEELEGVRVEDAFKKMGASKKLTDTQNPAIMEEKSREKLMLAEIERLRVKLHNAEQENIGLREKNNELRALSDSVRILSRQHEDDRKELHALREHVYHSTEEETDTREVDIAELERVIGEKRIVIIGGRDRWVNKLKAKFSGWRFISTDLSSAVDFKVFDGADFTYFFTEYIAHKTYSVYVKALRERNLPFGYIHSTNVEMNVRQIYEETK